MNVLKNAASAAALAYCLLSAPVHAQVAPSTAANEADGTVPEIVVTAQLRRESAQTVPIAVTAVTGDSLTRAGVASLQDLAAAVPGVVVSKSVSYGLAPIAIRGLGGPAGGGSLFTDQPVAVYVDGVYVPALAQSVSNFLDVDTMQVLRGPQGTLYGRNSTAGAILLGSKRPDLSQVGGTVSASYASFAAAAISGVLNLPLIADRLGLRLAVGHDSGGNWARNASDSRRFGGGENTTMRGTLRWQDDGGATIDLIVDHSNGTANPATLSLATVSPAPRGPTLGTVYVGNPYLRRADLATVVDNRMVEISGDQQTRTRATDFTLIAEVPLGGVTLTAISGYRNFRVSGTQDVSPAPTPAAITNTNNTVQQQKSFSQELRLGSNSTGPAKWILGAYYFHQETDAFINIINVQGGPPVATGFGATGPIFAGRPAGTTALFDAAQTVNSYALFADATYQLGDRLAVTGGIRYSRDEKAATIANTVRTITNSVLAGPILLNASCPSATTSCRGTYENVSPRAVVTFQATPRNMVYGSFSKGFNSGGFNNFGNVLNPSDPTNPLENGSERITNYEIGTKNEFFGRKLKLNIAAFQTEYRDLHIRQAVLTGGVAIVNVPKARVRGVEVETLLYPLDGLSLALNGSYLDGTIREGTLAALPSNAGTIVLGQNQTVVSQNVAGNRLSRAPRWQGSATLSYAVPTGFGTITPSVSWRGQTSVWFLETNQDNGQYRAAGWSEVDLRVALAGEDNKWELAAFGRNVFDRRYISQIVPFTGFPVATFNTPATWGLNGKINF
ncbi:TonB-dependent receptor [Novosphingobium piscinae]|uniref:TonB-dependent receptor n=1 Tax=Novosphingobium piscinae TaxID=1507448 RepID=A0A7X1FV87_9SPHN|nr:TonB-dependent receptor [Novosphingobium piscinae]MBC2667600.1 TonB-dependent receptor [Novosphingobium piscinae]